MFLGVYVNYVVTKTPRLLSQAPPYRRSLHHYPVIVICTPLIVYHMIKQPSETRCEYSTCEAARSQCTRYFVHICGTNVGWG